jgi:hypothetical protein
LLVWTAVRHPSRRIEFHVANSKGDNTSPPRFWTAKHFSLSNPKGPGQDDLGRLLRRLAEQIELRGPIDVLHIAYSMEVTEDGDWPTFTVFYNDAATDGSLSDLPK